MAYLLTCDNPACGARIEEASVGRPNWLAKRRVFCARCAGIVDSVEAEVRKQATQRALSLAQEIDALREKLMAEMMPPQMGGAATEGVGYLPRIEA